MKKLTKNESVAVGVALVATFGVLFLGNSIFSSAQPPQTKTVSGKANSGSGDAGISAELGIVDEVIGSGMPAKAGDNVSIQYLGMLPNGTMFDSSRDHGAPIDFTLGSGQVIPGFDSGVLGMKVGGKRRITIPPELGYGDRAIGPIPPNSTLIFEVELLEIVAAK